MINADIRELEDRIINTLNQSDVMIDVKRLIVANIYHQLKTQSDLVISQEINELNKGEEKEDEQSIPEVELC